MEQEILMEGFISSHNDKKTALPGTKTLKVLISVDNLRCTGYTLPEDHPDHTLDTFEIVETWIANPKNPLSKEDKIILDQFSGKDSAIIEFRYGTYIANPVWSKKKRGK